MARDRGFYPVMGMEIEFQLLFFALIFDNWGEEEIGGVVVTITWLCYGCYRCWLKLLIFNNCFRNSRGKNKSEDRKGKERRVFVVW